MDIESEFSNTGHGGSGMAAGGDEAHPRRGKKQSATNQGFITGREKGLFVDIL
jgi:hypothetical protein